MSDLPENTPALWRAHFPIPDSTSHKYSRGTALIRGGAVMTGATRLAARAAQRMGVGLVTLAVPTSALPIYAESLESVIVKPCDELAAWEILLTDKKDPAILIGPGLGLGVERAEEVLAALATKRPCVIDADALTNFADDPDALIKNLHAECVLTPHEGEFVKLFGAIVPIDSPAPRGRGQGVGVFPGRVDCALAAANRAGCIVLLKGAETIIAAPNGNTVVNRNAPPWLATAGSGDVLAGMILGLVAQKMDAFNAACAAAWMHSRIGTLCGPGLIAEDIVAGIPPVLSEIIAL